MILTLVGLLILILAFSLGEFYTGEDTTPVLLCAFFGFLIMDVCLTIIDSFTLEVLEDALPHAETDQISQWTNGWKQFGRVAAYALASCDALQLGTRYMYSVSATQHVGGNMGMAFWFAVIFLVLALIFILPAVQVQPQRLKKYTDSTHTHSLQVFLTSPIKLQLVFVAHFFSYGAFLLITIYATSWTGISVLSGVPTAEKYTLRRRIFEIGVSWGAFAMLLSTLVTMLTGLVLPIVRRNKYLSDGFIWGLSQAVAAVALLATSRITEFRGIFVILPLCGFAFATVKIFAEDSLKRLTHEYVVACKLMEEPHSAANCPGVPFKSQRNTLPRFLRVLKSIPDEGEILHLPEGIEPPWNALFSFTSLLGQVAMLSAIPSVFLLYPDSDDNKWGMVTAGVSSLVGSMCSFLI